jgi:hypothetical protein
MASHTSYSCDICGTACPSQHHDIVIGDARLTYKLPGKDWLNGHATHLAALVCDACRGHLTAAVLDTISDIQKGRLC